MSGAETGDARRNRLLRLLAWGGLVALASAPTGWVVTDVLERDNDFCNACHLGSGEPLHRELRKGFDAAPPASLAGAHGSARVDLGDDSRPFRCIDCHGGHGFVGRARVKVLAAKDSFWYVAGHFDEPEDMAWPLWDEDCSKCHTAFDDRGREAWESPRFHQLPVHNVDLGVDCVECHQVHESQVEPRNHFLRAPSVRTQCARCHDEFETPRAG